MDLQYEIARLRRHDFEMRAHRHRQMRAAQATTPDRPRDPARRRPRPTTPRKSTRKDSIS